MPFEFFRVVNHITWFAGHQHLIISLVKNRLYSWSHQGVESDLDLGKVQV